MVEVDISRGVILVLTPVGRDLGLKCRCRSRFLNAFEAQQHSDGAAGYQGIIVHE
jgi:hypothetical protein